jgi:NAD(P)-dependent dehydrogenase (short-subunit alcohol dehydrogenase family)
VKTAVISGGAGGLGQALTRALLVRGWQVLVLDLDVSHLAQQDRLSALECDLTDPDQLEQTMAQVLARHPGIDLAVYNAGITHIGAFEDTAPETHRKVFEINYFAAVAMARALLPAVRSAQGTHLAISSVAGFAPLHHRTAYAASKHAMDGFFGSLRSEEKPHGVRVQIAAPSFVATNIGDARTAPDGTARPGSASDGIDYMTPDQAVAEILRGLDKGQPMIPVGRVARLSWRIHRLFPRLYQHLMERRISGA